jgi:hypothetical protein
MFTRLITIFTILILIISGLIIILDSGVGTENLENESQSHSNVQTNPRSNGGINWSQIEVISEPIMGQNNNVGDSVVAKIAVEDNKIYVVWRDENNTNGAGTDPDIFYRYYDGSKWSEIQVISEPIVGSDNNTGFSSYPDIAVENGKIYVVWHDHNNTNNAGTDKDIFYRCNLTGTDWEDIQVISEPVPGKNFNGDSSWEPAIAVENGRIYVVWYDSNKTNGAGTDYDIFYRCNITGSSWEDVQVISEPIVGSDINNQDCDDPKIAIENDKIYVVWQDFNDTNGAGTDGDIFYRCNLTGSGWEDIQVISEPVPGQNFNIEGSWQPALAVENGNIYIVWLDNNDTNSAGPDADIFYRCNLTGTSWETVQVISEPVPEKDINVGNSGHPIIAVNNSKIHIVWEDQNNTNGASKPPGPVDYDIFLRRNLTGSGWEDIQVISEPVQGNNFNTGVSWKPDIGISNNRSHVVWRDSNNTNGAGGDDDIFYRSILLPIALNLPSVTPTFGNTSTYFNYSVTYTHIKNKAPSEITVNISSTAHSMIAMDIGDTNYLDGKNYYFNITHLNIGMHTYQFRASDGFNNILTPIYNNPNVYNTPPNITTLDNLTAIEDTYYEVLYQYEDIDLANVGQTGTWNYSTNATWLNFNPTTATLYGTPANSDVGTYWINISINDTMDMDFTNFTLTVVNENDNPIIETIDVEITYEDDLYEVDYNASDIDSLISNQMWLLNSNATSWLVIDSLTGIISGTPTNDEVGEYWVNVSLDDGDLGLAFSNYTLIVLNVNDRPEIITEDELTANANILYLVDYNATDIDSPLSQLTWSLNTNATWLGLDSSTGVLSGTPATSDVGRFNVNITVDDGDDGQDWHDFVITVITEGFENDPPEITTIDKVSTTAGTSYNVIYEATDDRTPLESLLWSYNSNASWLSFNKITRTLSGNPTLSEVGWYWVNVTVFDGEGGFDSHNFTLMVWATANEPPDILTDNDVNAVVDELYSVDYEAEDDHTPLDKLVWSLETNTSDWLDIDPVTGVLSGTPKLDDVGSYWVKVSVFDNEDGWDHSEFTLYVTTEPITDFKPELSNPSMTPTSGDTNTEFTFSVDYSHPNGDSPDSIQVVIDGEGYDMTTTNGHYEYKTKLSEGNHTYYFTTKLGEFKVDTGTFNTGYITKVEDPPEDGDGEEDNTMLYAILVVVVIIIVVLILLFIFLKKKKGKEEPPVEEAQPPPPEEVPTEVPPEQVPPPEAPTPEQPPTPEVPPEQVPAPEVPQEQPQVPEVPSEQPPTPEVIPQVPQPQVEPAPPAPMPQVEEQPAPQPQVEPQPQGQAPVPSIKTKMQDLEQNDEYQ